MEFPQCLPLSTTARQSMASAQHTFIHPATACRKKTGAESHRQKLEFEKHYV
jgi:hypothetical protein